MVEEERLHPKNVSKIYSTDEEKWIDKEHDGNMNVKPAPDGREFSEDAKEIKKSGA